MDNGLFNFNLKFLFLVGLWPKDDFDEKEKLLYKIYEIILHLLTAIFFVITGIGLGEIQDLTLFLTNLDKILVAYNFWFKTLLFIAKRNKLKKLIESIEKSNDTVTEERKKLMVVTLAGVTIISVFIVSIFSVLALVKEEMTIEAWMPFDSLENRQNLILSAQILAIVFLPGLLRAFAIQGLVCSLIMYLCDQLIDLQTMIRQLNHTKDTDFETRRQFKAIITKHVRLIRYSKAMDRILKEYFLVQHLAIIFELCLNAVMITVVSDITLLITFLAYLSVALINAYIYSYLGNQLIIQSQGVAMAAYKSSWTSWSIDMQKCLIIIICVAQKPLALSAGGMVPLSIQTFGQALYNGYSIFAVLNDLVD